MSSGIGPITPPEPSLPIPPEPTAVKDALRAAVGEDPINGRRAAVEEVARLLWEAWDEDLTAMGGTWPGFSAVVAGAANEVWLWVMGDRPFDQLAVSLGGRTIRRLT